MPLIDFYYHKFNDPKERQQQTLFFILLSL